MNTELGTIVIGFGILSLLAFSSQVFAYVQAKQKK
jgi:hypothetical protein